MSNKDSNTSAKAPELIDKEELRRILGLPSKAMVEQLMRKRKIPYIRLGYRTIRFSLPKVLAALERLEIRAVGSDRR